MGTGNGGTKRIAVTGPGTWVVETEDNAISENEWNHIVYSRNGTGMGNHKIFVNGEEQQLLTENNYNFTDNDIDKLIGSKNGSTGFYSGILEEMRLWNIVRTEEEIRENMYIPLVGNETGLVSYWQFNEDSGTNVDEVISGNDGTLNNMDEEDWIDSTIPFGDGISDSQTETAGTVDFTDTGLSMFFNSHNVAEITVTRIDTIPNINPTEPDEVFDAQYWIVNRYGTGTFDTDLTFTISEDLTAEDEENPSQIKLYTRSSNADSNWIHLTEASSVNALTDEVTFNSITEFSQFIVTRWIQSLDAPQNVTITVSDSVYISWDAVNGANSYKIYASDDPYATDWGTAVDSVAVTSWSETITQNKRFYRVTASTESETRDSDLEKRNVAPSSRWERKIKNHRDGGATERLSEVSLKEILPIKIRKVKGKIKK